MSSNLASLLPQVDEDESQRSKSNLKTKIAED
jgi:hypothetical protein